jgi:putative acetyltransferase
MPTTNIITYQDRYHADFKALNVEWLERYGLLEPHDVEILDHPKEMIIDNGGFIYLAESNGAIIGSAALMKEHDGVYELVKMAVAENFRGKGISKLLLEACLQQAKTIKARKIILFSNHQLKAALGLYEKYGFNYIEVEDSPFLTADIKMELDLV